MLNNCPLCLKPFLWFCILTCIQPKDKSGSFWEIIFCLEDNWGKEKPDTPEEYVFLHSGLLSRMILALSASKPFPPWPQAHIPAALQRAPMFVKHPIGLNTQHQHGIVAFPWSTIALFFLSIFQMKLYNHQYVTFCFKEEKVDELCNNFYRISRNQWARWLEMAAQFSRK